METDINISVERSVLRLTPRGKDVFKLVLNGLTIAQIADRLGISYSGVLRHREKMLLQNCCHSMGELIAKHHNGRHVETDHDVPSYEER